MADLIGVLGFTLHTVHKICSVVQSIKRAPEAVQTLGKEASRVENLLTMMLSVQNGSHTSPTVSRDTDQFLFTSLAEDAQTLTAAAGAFLDKATKLNADGVREPKTIRWPLYASRAKELAGRFETFYLSLAAVYAVSILCVSFPFSTRGVLTTP